MPIVQTKLRQLGCLNVVPGVTSMWINRLDVCWKGLLRSQNRGAVAGVGMKLLSL